MIDHASRTKLAAKFQLGPALREESTIRPQVQISAQFRLSACYNWTLTKQKERILLLILQRNLEGIK